MYLNTIETCQIATSRFAGPGFPDENYRRELLGKVPGLAARGVTAALLFPVEVLNCLVKRFRTGDG